MGTQVVQIDWRHQPSSVLHLLWSVSFVLAVFYGIYTQDPFRIDTIASGCASGKPLYVYFVHFATKYTYSTVYLLQSVHIFLHGRSLVQLLDSACFRRFYASTRRAWVAFAVFLLANHLFFVTVMFERLKLKRLLAMGIAIGQSTSGPSGSAGSYWPSPSDLLTYLCLYVVFQFVYWLYIALHYAQYGILGSLTALQNALKKKDEEEEEVDEALVIDELRSLALISRRLSRLLSWPLLSYLFVTISNIVLVICLAIICQPNLIVRLAAHIITSCCYANYVAWLNWRIRRRVAAILEALRARHTGRRDTEALENLFISSKTTVSLSSSSTVTAPFPPIQLYWTIIQIENEPSMKTTSTKRFESLESRRIRIQELELYEPFFHLNVFQITDIDQRFIFQSCVFVLGYVVFLSQTH